jgi:hypothetical protein
MNDSNPSNESIPVEAHRPKSSRSRKEEKPTFMRSPRLATTNPIRVNTTEADEIQ